MGDPVLSHFGGRTILITGASGFLAASVIRRLQGVPCTIRRLYHRAPAEAEAASGSARFENVEGDVADPSTWQRAMVGVDVVIHLAAQTSVYTAAEDPIADLTVNARSMLHLALACERTGTRPIVVAAGTATVVGLTRSDTPMNEAPVEIPITFYDIHKLMAERYLDVYTHLEILRAVTLRLANVYGPGPRGRKDRGFLNAMIQRALNGEVLTLYGKGEQVRDYVYVDDVARAFLAAAAFIDTLAGNHFLIGSGQGTTLARAVQLVAERVGARTGRAVRIASVEPPKGLSAIEQRSFVADCRRFRVATGWSPAVTLPEGIDRTAEALNA